MLFILPEIGKLIVAPVSVVAVMVMGFEIVEFEFLVGAGVSLGVELGCGVKKVGVGELLGVGGGVGSGEGVGGRIVASEIIETVPALQSLMRISPFLES